MLATFTVRDFGPFRDECVLDMRAARPYEEHLAHCQTMGEEELLKVAVIYGANASGKSQFVKACEVFRRLVLESFDLRDRSQAMRISRDPSSGAETELRDTKGSLRECCFPYMLDPSTGDTEFPAGRRDRRAGAVPERHRRGHRRLHRRLDQRRAGGPRGAHGRGRQAPSPADLS